MNRSWISAVALMVSLSLTLAACGSDSPVSNPKQFTIGGAVSGLTGEVTLRNNGGDDLVLSADGAFTFAGAVNDGAMYEVTVFAQPSGQTCTVTMGTGTIAGANVTDIVVACTDGVTYAVGGTITGLSGSVTLQNMGVDDLTLTNNGPFTFATRLPDASSYQVTVLTEPSGQTCLVTGGSGAIAGSDVTSVIVSCTDIPVGSVEDYGDPSGMHRLNDPWGLFVDSLDRIYIADTLNHRIIRMDNMSATNWISYGGTQGTSPGEFDGPVSIAVDGSGTIYISDNQNHRIVMIDDMLGANWRSYGTSGSVPGNFSFPNGISINGAGQIYIADTLNDRVVRIDDESGTNWTAFGTGGVGIGRFAFPLDVKEYLGKIYILDSNNSRLVRIDDMTGAGWTEFGSFGSSTNQFSVPRSMNVTGSGFVVSDYNNNRLIRFSDMSGTNWTTMNSAGGFSFFKLYALASDSSGNIFLSIHGSDKIIKFSPTLFP